MYFNGKIPVEWHNDIILKRFILFGFQCLISIEACQMTKSLKLHIMYVFIVIDISYYYKLIYTFCTGCRASKTSK